MNRFKRLANACSSTTLPSKALNRFAMTQTTPKTDRCSGKGIHATASDRCYRAGSLSERTTRLRQF